MTPEQIAMAVSIVGGVSAIIYAWSTRGHDHVRDRQKDAREDAELESDIKYIARGVDDIRLEQRAQREQMGAMSERLTRVEESSKQAHKRLDRIDTQRREHCVEK